MFAKLKILGAAAIAALLMAAPAHAAPVIDFSTGLAGAGGTISWDGTNVFGSNIPIGAVSVTGAPSGNGSFAVTGTSAGQGVGGFGTLNFNTNPDNNFISISGCIPGLSVGLTANGTCAPITLMTGAFTSFTGSANGLTNAMGVDVKNIALLRAIGFDSELPWEFFGSSIITGQLTPNGPPGLAVSTDIRNTGTLVPTQQSTVPEPATMMLLGTGLLAAFKARRRQA